VRDPQSPLAQTPLARATRRGDGEAGLLITMHNQHRSPDPTKIERATATCTVALFFNFFNVVIFFNVVYQSKYKVIF